MNKLALIFCLYIYLIIYCSLIPALSSASSSESASSYSFSSSIESSSSSFSSEDFSDFSSDSSINDDDSSLNDYLCEQLGEEFFVQIKSNGFESFDGWNDTFGVIFRHNAYDFLDNFEGLGLAIFTKQYSLLSSHPIQFPNYTVSQENSKVTDLFKSIELDINFFFRIYPISSNSSSSSEQSDSGRYFTGSQDIQESGTGVSGYSKDYDGFSLYSKLDLKNIEFNKPKQQLEETDYFGNDDEPDFLEILIDEESVLNISQLYFDIEPTFQSIRVDVSKFLDGNNHTIHFIYHWTGYYEKRFTELGIEVDYINFIPIPLKTIEGDIYVSKEGNDYSGNGSITNSFCSIQMALYSMVSGGTIRLMDDQQPLWPMYLWKAYVVDTVGKDVNIIGVNTKIETLRNITRGSSFLCNGGICNFQNITFECYYPNDVMVLTTRAQFNFTNSILKNNPMYQSIYQGIVIGPKNSTVTVRDSDFYVCQGCCLFGSFDSVYGMNINFHEAAATILDVVNENMTIHFNNLTFIDIKTPSVLPFTTNFDTIILENIFFNGAVGDGSNLGLSLENGNLAILRNFSMSSGNSALNLVSVSTVILDNFIVHYTDNLLSLISISDNDETIITNFNIFRGPITVVSYFYFNQSRSVTIDSLLYTDNEVSLVNLNNVNNFSMTNSIFERCSKQVLILSTESSLNFANITVTNSPTQFLSAFNSSATFENVGFFDNYNLNTNSLEPMINFEDMEAVYIKNLTSVNNLNFELVKFVNCHSAEITESFIEGQLLGNIFSIQMSTVNITSTSILNSFLANDYPIHCTNSKLYVSDCFFFNTSQYFFIDSSEFNISNTIFENMITVVDESYYINESSGRFENITIGPTDPHIGLVITNSTVDHYSCNYFNISSLNNTLGLYTNSLIKFDGCTFKNNAAAVLMMTFDGGKTVFNNCIFDSLSSLDTSILKSWNQEFLYFNSSIIRYCQSNGNGVDAAQTNALFENSIVIFNYYIEGNLFKMVDSNISFCNITHYYNEANYYVQNGNVFIEFFFASYNYFQSNLIELDSSSTITLRESNITHNDGFSILEITDSKIFLNDSIFESNSLVESLTSIYRSSMVVHNVSWIENTTSKNGSCINAWASTLILLESSFLGNVAVVGGVSSIYQCNVTIDKCNFQRNSASYDGSDFSQNGCGACFYVIDYSSNIAAADSSFYYNNASHRGGVFYLQNSMMVPGSDSPYIPQANFTNCYFYENSADFGPGGVCYSELREGCSNDLLSTFSKNVATYGDVYASSVSYFDFLPIVSGTHPFTTFTIGLSLFDFYDQSMLFLDFLANYTLWIYDQENNVLVFNTSMDLEYQGFIEVDVTLNYTLGTQFIINATAELEGYQEIFKANTTIYMTQCNIGFEIGTNQNCTPCPIGYYGYDGVSCIKCDINKAICPGKSTIYPQSGYWILLEYSQPPDIYPCDPAYCLQRTCREGQNGTLCSVCNEGYSKVKMFCQECDGINWAIIAGLVVFVGLYIFIMSTFTIPSASIIFNYLLVVQTVAVFAYNIQYLTILPLFGLDVDYWPETCMDPSITYILKQFIALCGMLFIITPISIRVSWCRDLIIRSFPHLKVFVTEFFDRNIFYSIISFLLCFYTPITYISLALVSCIRVGDNLYLSQDPSVQCFTKEHWGAFVIACIMILVVSLGVPIYIFVQIRKKNRYFLKIFFEKYRPSFQWWDLILLSRSILYILVTFIFTYEFMYIKGLAISTLGLLYTFLTWICQPYKSQYKNDMEVYLSLILCLTGIMVNTRSFNTTEVFSGIVLSLSGIGALIPIAICIHHISKKIFPTGLQTTNPPTTKIRTKSNDTPRPIKSINDDGEYPTDTLLSK
ncbi:hypothetical protein RB653_000916 [Dictyostelium firmibasis]|uniref:Uncharacterized protein n=1 Tax=Dictyostelium firmibasis TaxID=79012 RepID=A0AAN7TXK6_9MYCE